MALSSVAGKHFHLLRRTVLNPSASRNGYVNYIASFFTFYLDASATNNALAIKASEEIKAMSLYWGYAIVRCDGSAILLALPHPENSLGKRARSEYLTRTKQIGNRSR